MRTKCCTPNQSLHFSPPSHFSQILKSLRKHPLKKSTTPPSLDSFSFPSPSSFLAQSAQLVHRRPSSKNGALRAGRTQADGGKRVGDGANFRHEERKKQTGMAGLFVVGVWRESDEWRIVDGFFEVLEMVSGSVL